jgi:succinate dehydrogenase/fumarate reductase flavoprotein subunit
MGDFDVIDALSVENWNHTADVVVVGLGAAGVCAAIEAREAGASVLVLERASGGGGTTAMAAGHVYAGGGTPVQEATGFEDSAEAMFNYMMAATPEPDENKIRLYCDQSLSHFNWLEEQGVPFNRTYYPHKNVYQPTDECLIWTGNEKVWPYREKAAPAPRGHKVAKEGEDGGSLLMETLIKKAESIGVEIMCDAGVRNLVMDEGRVVGLRYKKFDDIGFVRANNGVILCAGGFAMNKEMLAEYCPRLAQKGIYRQGNPNDDGGGICLGMSAGGATAHMDGCFITSPIYPPEQLLKGILVNKDGKRFVAEDSYHSRTASFCLDQPEGKVFLIVDNAIFARPELVGQPLIDAWENVEEMEQALDMPEGSLCKTMADYNLHAESGADPEFHKYKDWVQPLTEGPYGAFDCSFGTALYIGFTLGGLITSVDAEVLGEDGVVIPGLYAAGACASNIAQDAIGYSSGTCIGESTFFGRRAGLAASSA